MGALFTCMLREEEVREQVSVTISRTTREALRNLFHIMDIRAATFDGRLMELATRAFSARADLNPNRRTLRTREAHGHKVGRRQMEIKETTADQLQDLHSKLFPYLPWTSWDWYLNQLADMAEIQLHVKRENVNVFSG